MEKNPHIGHRQRMKETYRKFGADQFNEHQLVELLLFYGIPQGDVNPLAHALLDRFGSIHTMLEASYEQLRDVKGVGEHTALLIKLCGDLVKRCGIEKHPIKSILNSTQEIGDFLLPRFWGEHEEILLMLSMNHRLEVLNVTEVSRGSFNATPVNMERIRRRAVLDEAQVVILAHNHPAGHAIPSKADVEATAEVSKMLRFFDITLLDHIVVADGDYVSMRDTPTMQFALQGITMEDA